MPVPASSGVSTTRWPATPPSQPGTATAHRGVSVRRGVWAVGHGSGCRVGLVRAAL